MFKQLDPLLHSQLRLQIISILYSTIEAEFKYLKDKTEATAGNLSVQITKLHEAGYINVKKSFRDNFPLTTCSITKKGKAAFETYIDALKGYLPS